MELVGRARGGDAAAFGLLAFVCAVWLIEIMARASMVDPTRMIERVAVPQFTWGQTLDIIEASALMLLASLIAIAAIPASLERELLSCTACVICGAMIGDHGLRQRGRCLARAGELMVKQLSRKAPDVLLAEQAKSTRR